MRKGILFGLLLACLCHVPAAETAEKIVYWTTNSADEAACQGQLNFIYGALREYQKRNQRLPNWLSDLVPDYIDEPKTLICPFVVNTGILKKWREKYHLPVFTDPGSCSYAYEFCARKWYVPGWTTRTYKERQMELIGFSVPIVRCIAHRPSLNLGFDGSIYPSPSSGEWEDIFIKSPQQKPVFHNAYLLTNIIENRLISRLIEPRMVETDERMLDLSVRYNAALFHLSQIDRSGKLLAPYPEGAQRIGGIDFDARGLIHLAGTQFPIAFPEKVESIPVNRRCASIHFLHGATSVATNGSKIASLRVHFDGGRTAELPIIYGRDVRARWFDRSRKSEWENPTPAWISPPDKVGPNGKSLRLYVSSWKNPAPEAEVASIDFISAMSESAPFLLAITTE